MTQLDQQLNYLGTLRRFETIKPGLDTMQKLLSALGDPQQKFCSLHIAGTNGKGSTATFLANILQQSQLHPTPYPLNPKIGLYTSPFIQNFNERIQINGKPIADQELSGLIARTKHAADINSASRRIDPTYFEFATALAFLHFANEQVDTAVIEVGMGGGLDATNVITPAVSIITNIGLDHTDWLGSTKQQIAEQKAGIIKEGVPVVTAETDPDILAYLHKVARQKNTKVYPVQNYLTATITEQTLDSQTFTTQGVINNTFTIKMLGEHQVTNALTALLARHVLENEKPPRARHGPVRGLKKAFIPGRLEIVSREPFILADGAHNEDGVKTLARFLDDYKKLLPKPDVLIVGAKFDKDVSVLVEKIIPRFRQIVVTEANYQPMPAKKLAAKISERHSRVRAIPKVGDALVAAQQELTPDAMLLITGSLYLVGDALKALRT